METQTSPKLGNYVLTREAGRGGMSTVYEAVDTRIGRTVALKVLAVPQYLSAGQREALVARIKREGRAVARMSHPNIVEIYDVGDQDGLHFLVMEFLDGVTLRARLDTGPLSPDETAEVLDQVAAGLDAVHAQGVVHRDIKPSNVMLLPGRRVKLMDFGVARQADDTTMTQAGSMVGSPAYMAPEQVRGGAATPASDLWALGVLVYEMLAGKPPFVGDNIPSVLYQVAHKAPEPLHDVSPAIQKVVHRALEKDPGRRYGTARELADAFRTAVAPVESAGPRRPRRALAGVKGGAVTAAAPLAPAGARTFSVARKRWPAAAALLLLATAFAAAPVVLRSNGDDRQRAAERKGAPPARPRTDAIEKKPAPTPRAVATPSVKPAPAAPKPARPARRETRRPERQVAAEPAPAGTAAPRRTRQRPNPTRPERPQVATAAKPPARKPSPAPEPPARVVVLPPPVSPSADEPPPATVEPPATVVEPLRPEPSESERPTSDEGAGPRLTGTWRGTHTRQGATLTITRQQGQSFGGVLTVRTRAGRVRVAVAGSVSPRTGRVRLREVGVVSQPQPNSWDLGSNTGRMSGAGRMSGTGRDVQGRSYAWSFSR